MQIMPPTGAELARTLDLLDIRDPLNNIQGGVYYLSWLNNQFRTSPPGDRLKLALAAYNAGIGRVYDAQELTKFFRGNPNRWNSVRYSLALLGSDQFELHSVVWNEGRPRCGVFDNPGETLASVDKVLDSYGYYQKILD